MVEEHCNAVGFVMPVVRAPDGDMELDQLTATGKLVIDRTKYEMKFRSGNFFKDLGDTLIYNDFELNVSVTAKAHKERFQHKNQSHAIR